MKLIKQSIINNLIHCQTNNVVNVNGEQLSLWYADAKDCIIRKYEEQEDDIPISTITLLHTFDQPPQSIHSSTINFKPCFGNNEIN